MKTTFDLPEALFVAAKKKAAESRTTLRDLVARGLRRELRSPTRSTARTIRWVTVKGGLPADVDVSSRAAMHEWLRRQR